MTAHTAVIFTRYMMLSVENGKELDKLLDAFILALPKELKGSLRLCVKILKSNIFLLLNIEFSRSILLYLCAKFKYYN